MSDMPTRKPEDCPGTLDCFIKTLYLRVADFQKQQSQGKVINLEDYKRDVTPKGGEQEEGKK